MIYDHIVKEIEQKKLNREQGKFNGIPFPFERYREYVPSIDKGDYLGLLGSPGAGKSRFVRFLMYYMLDFSWQNEYPVKILYFALEDGVKSIYKKIMAHYLYERHGVRVPLKILESKDRPLPNEYLYLIRQDREFYAQLEDSMYIINDNVTASSIFERCKKAIDVFGKTHHMIAIIDNYSNLVKDKHHLNEHEAIGQLSREYIRLELCKKMDMSVIGVTQQDFDTERNAFRQAGRGSIANIEPNMGSLGNNKEISRNFFTLFALFNPYRYDLKTYPHADPLKNWRIDILRNRFRSLIMLKSNNGEEAPRLGLYFDGLREHFEEMPSLDNQEALQAMYERIQREETERKERLARGTLF